MSNNLNATVPFNLTLVELSPVSAEEKHKIIANWLARNKIEYVETANKQYKILNGCVPNIMFYPSTSKVMIQDGGKNYIIQTTAENILATIKGDMPYKKETL